MRSMGENLKSVTGMNVHIGTAHAKAEAVETPAIHSTTVTEGLCHDVGWENNIKFHDNEQEGNN